MNFENGKRMLPNDNDEEAIKEQQLQLASRLIDKSTATMKGNHSYSPFFTEYALMAEYNLLDLHKLPGLYVVPSADTPHVWLGVLFIRQGIYQNAVFSFSIDIPKTFPDCSCPSVTFQPPAFHPLIHPESGLLDTSRAFPKWRSNLNHLWQLLLYARRVFYKIETTLPLNPEASVIFTEDQNLYKTRISESISKCKQYLQDLQSTSPHDDDNKPVLDAHQPVFDALNDHQLTDVKKKMQEFLASSADLPRATGHGFSWIKSGSQRIFSSNKTAVT